jgi:hypothetical protein
MMTEERLLKDVNLSDIQFSEDHRSVALAFLSMSDGAEVGTLVCSGLAFFAYSNDPDESLPSYAGEVSRRSIPGADEARRLLQGLGYGYRDFSGMRLVDNSATLYHVHVEGSFTLDVVCREARLVR